MHSPVAQCSKSAHHAKALYANHMTSANIAIRVTAPGMPSSAWRCSISSELGSSPARVKSGPATNPLFV